MKIKNIIKELEKKNLLFKVFNEREATVKGLQNDSRKVKDGFLYFAIKGFSVDGHDYIESAIKNGAFVVVCEYLPLNMRDNVTYLLVSESRKAMAVLSNLYYGFPTAEMKIIGVTGTNGKTSTTYILEAVLKEKGYKTGIIGTIGYKIGDKTKKLNNTTPDSIELFFILKEMKDKGVEFVIMEVSSHALELYRVYGIDFDMAVFTNLTRDHLDFHENMEDYYQAKKKLFSEYLSNSQKSDKKALVNIDDPFGARLFKEIEHEKYSLSLNSNSADFFIKNYTLRIDKTYMEISGIYLLDIVTKLVGEYNLYNILTAVVVAQLYKIDKDTIKRALSKLAQIPGRLQQVEGANIFIDYAHTPDAVKKAVKTLKELTQGKLITIMGAGGDRDRSKRPFMTLSAFENSDFLILTSDNPRTENPSMILDDLERPLIEKNAGKDYARIEDRAVAIKRGVEMLEKDDVLLICGKGHEDYQIIGTEKIHFSDYEEVLKHLNK